MGADPLTTKGGKLNINPIRGTHCDLYRNQKYFDCSGFLLPKLLRDFIIRRKGKCVFSEYYCFRTVFDIFT